MIDQFSEDEWGEAAREVVANFLTESVTCKLLYGDVDRNYCIVTQQNRRYVLKITPDASEKTRRLLETQIAALEHLSAKTLAVNTPVAMRSLAGNGFVTITGPDGVQHLGWLLSWLDGSLLDEIDHYASGLLQSIGATVAVVDKALMDFEDDHARDRHLKWDLMRLPELRSTVAAIKNAKDRDIVEHCLDGFESEALPELRLARHSIIHNDGGNQHNMLVSAKDSDARISAIIDFGDLVSTPTVCGLGIAAAYATFGVDEPARALLETTRGYAGVIPLGTAELNLIPWLVLGRLTMSVIIAADNTVSDPADNYADASRKPAWRSLRKLSTIGIAGAQKTIRDGLS